MSEFKSITNSQAEELIRSEKELLIIDVRKEKEFEESKLPGAINIPVDELEWEIQEYENYKDKPVLVYCNVGHKSIFACNILLEEGFNKIYNLGQGILGYTGKIEK